DFSTETGPCTSVAASIRECCRGDSIVRGNAGLIESAHGPLGGNLGCLRSAAPFHSRRAHLYEGLGEDAHSAECGAGAVYSDTAGEPDSMRAGHSAGRIAIDSDTPE